MSKQVNHELEFSEENGEGWATTCSCGEVFWEETESAALNSFAEHQEKTTK